MDVMVLDLDVIQEDINKGTRKSCSCCPVALAVRRAFGRGIMPEIRVSRFRIRIHDGELLWAAGPPREVADFISAFDGNRDRGRPEPAPFRTTLTFKKTRIG